jgi:hypothetical protein
VRNGERYAKMSRMLKDVVMTKDWKWYRVATTIGDYNDRMRNDLSISAMSITYAVKELCC